MPPPGPMSPTTQTPPLAQLACGAAVVVVVVVVVVVGVVGAVVVVGVVGVVGSETLLSVVALETQIRIEKSPRPHEPLIEYRRRPEILSAHNMLGPDGISD